jgi:hypothetical protein
VSPAFEPGLCANCDSSAVTVKTLLFCSQWCRQVAEFSDECPLVPPLMREGSLTAAVAQA